MAKICLFVCLYLLIGLSQCQDIFGGFVSDFQSCEQVCRNTYPLHTYPKPDDLCSCLRGCRLFSIIDAVEEYTDINATRNSCVIECKNAYDSKSARDACALGCNHQKSFFIPFHKLSKEVGMDMSTPEDAVINPFLYMHNFYSNMMDKLSNSVSVSWSYYTQNENGKLVVVRSQPSVIIYSSDPDYKTQNYIETNLVGVDSSATPNLKHSQQSLDSQRLALRDLEATKVERREGVMQDWLSCISKKTGLSKFILCLIIFLSALSIVWFCLSSAFPGKDRKIQIEPQKLSFYGDLDYLRELDDKGVLTKSSPQCVYQQASPLPIKIQVHSV